MDTGDALRKGLESTPKYLPVWYRYDKNGSLLNDKCLSDNTYYYFYSSEVEVLNQHVKTMIQRVPKPVVLVEMGSGNSVKSRLFIDALLALQGSLSYYPVDISSEFLQETADALAKDYGDKLTVCPIAGDYNIGIDRLAGVQGNKLVIWLGGGFQNQAYGDQVDRINRLSKHISQTDKLFISLDVSSKASEIQDAYLDPTGVSAPLYLNAIWRLNREYGSAIDTDKFDMEVKYVHREQQNTTSYVACRARSKCDQTYEIPGLKVSVTFKEGEYLNFFEGEGNSCKYSRKQIAAMVTQGGLMLHETWVDTKNHVSVCCIGLALSKDQ